MPTTLKSAAKRILAAALEAAPVVLRMIKVPYWAIVRAIINYWGQRGLHSIAVGQFAGRHTRPRSSYREDMLLRTILLFVNTRDKSCLDLACNDGFWSFRLARFGLSSVRGIDVGKEPIVRANFLKHVYDFPSFQFQQQDIFALLHGNQPESYDIILLLSILYHLPEETNWNKFFGALSRINDECVIIDSRWFEDNAYWYKKTSGQARQMTGNGLFMKWRPTRKEVFAYLYASGYAQVVEINPSAFLADPQAAYGNGDPYTMDNVSDYITGHRTLIIAYKEQASMSNILDRLTVEYPTREK